MCLLWPVLRGQTSICTLCDTNLPQRSLLAVKTRRRTEKKKRFREQNICSRTWGIRGMKKKMPIYIHIRDGVVGRHWFLCFFLSLFLGSERSNMKPTPRCQSWHVIRRNMVMNAKRLVQRAEISTGAVLESVYGVPANTLCAIPLRKSAGGWMKSLGQ